MTKSDEGLDCTQLGFPSDRMCIKDLRRFFPQEIDVDPGVPFFNDRRLSGLIADLIYAERKIAEFAFGEGPRLEMFSELKGDFNATAFDRALEEEKRLCIKKLVELYQVFGLASGPEGARHLIREIETAVGKIKTSKSSQI